MTLTIEDLAKLHGEKRVREFFERQYPSDYSSFLEIVRDCLDRAVVEAQRAAQYLFEAGEDHITTFIVSNLRAQQLDANHDTDSGGHVDIFIEDADRRFSWAAEAKIDTDWPWVGSGVGQLMDRYADGTTGRSNGGLIIYVKNENLSSRMKDWREIVNGKYGSCTGYSESDCPHRNPFAFYTECVYPKTGEKFRIRHIGVTLFRKASSEDQASKEAATQSAATILRRAGEVASAAVEAQHAAKGVYEELTKIVQTRTFDQELHSALSASKVATEKSEAAAQIATKHIIPKPAKAVRRGRKGA